MCSGFTETVKMKKKKVKKKKKNIEPCTLYSLMVQKAYRMKHLHSFFLVKMKIENVVRQTNVIEVPISLVFSGFYMKQNVERYCAEKCFSFFSK